MATSSLKVCVVTGSRADYGLLYCVIREIDDCADLTLQVVATGTHLSAEFGYTVRAIESDGIPIAARVEMLLSSDTGQGIAKSIGLGVIGFADTYARLDPDLVLVLGDRFEVLAAVVAALPARIAVAHIAGGDVTEGAFDEAIRHAITKMAHLHFVTNEVAARRVIQLGEEPSRIFNVGSPGIDYILRARLVAKHELERELGITLCRRNVVVTFHPPTLDPGGAAEQFKELLAALEVFDRETGIVFTYPNADNESRALIPMIEAFAAARPHTYTFASLGQRLYLSLLLACDLIVGNSSSALYEAPTLKKAAVNIGDRQKGRLQASSIVNCLPERKAIFAAMEQALRLDCSNVVNPYGDGQSAQRIVTVLRAQRDPRALLRKRFIDTGHCHV